MAPSLYNGGDECAGSCLDVAQDALIAIKRKFKRPNFTSIMPNRWFINFGWHNNNRMYNLVPRPLIPSVKVGQGHFGTPLDD